jgi:hypothetical protein
MILGLELIRAEQDVNGPTSLGVDNQAVIMATALIQPTPSHHIWDLFHQWLLLVSRWHKDMDLMVWCSDNSHMHCAAAFNFAWYACLATDLLLSMVLHRGAGNLLARLDPSCAALFASISTLSFPSMPTCPSIHIRRINPTLPSSKFHKLVATLP